MEGPCVPHVVPAADRGREVYDDVQDVDINECPANNNMHSLSNVHNMVCYGVKPCSSCERGGIVTWKCEHRYYY